VAIGGVVVGLSVGLRYVVSCVRVIHTTR
jgi:hypothetical protein